MLDEFKKNYTLVRILIILLIIATGSYVLSLAWGVISQFMNIFVILLLAWLLSFILEPVVGRIEKIKIPKIIATIITYALVSAILAAISLVYVPLVASQIPKVTSSTTLFLQSAPPVVTDFSKSLNSQLGKSATVIPSVTQFLFLSFITLILSFYFIVDREKINREFFTLVPKPWHSFLRFTQRSINEVFVSFLRVQLFYGISTAILTWIILTAFNIEFAASVAFISGIFAFIPLIGPFLALIPAVLVALLVSPVVALIVGAILLIVQQVIFNVIGPKLLGKAFEIHPALILISFLIGLQLAGAVGAVFAIPVLGIGALMIRRFGHYFLSIKDEAVEMLGDSKETTRKA